MSAQEIIEQIKELPPAERAQVTKFVVETDDSWIPDEFKEAMQDADAGGLDKLAAMANDPQIQRKMRLANPSSSSPTKTAALPSA